MVLHIAHKCKLAILGPWKKSEQREITLQISRKGEIHTFGIARKCIWTEGNYTENCWQIQISQIGIVENLLEKANHTAYC